MLTRNYTVAVRALCEFTAKAGDLDLRFTPAPTAQEGIAGHLLVAGRRGAGYEAEVPLSGNFGPLTVRGRADGYDPALNRLEEIKTFKGRLSLMPANHRALHWAQVKVYGALLCAARQLSDIELALVYFDIGTQAETLLTERHSATALAEFFEAQCQRFIAWATQEVAHRTARDAALTALTFPHADFRTGQRPLAEAAYKAAVAGRCLLAQAPTGIGKTIATIFPLLKAMPGQTLDKLFFLTAKTSGRGMALDAFAVLHGHAPELPLRRLELVARDKACEHPELACHGDSCPLAQGFYDRLPAARSAAVAQPNLDRASVRNVALAHQICPYYLSQELARWSDVVIGDYNYFFDGSALLHGLTQAQQWRVAVLVDEAHNLVERGRKMYSADLQQSSLQAARYSAPAALKKPLDKLQRCLNALSKAQAEPYQVYNAIPLTLLTALQQASSAVSDYLTEHPTEVDAALQAFYFEALHFAKLAESFDKNSLCDLSKTATALSKTSATWCLRNVVPAPFLKPRWAAAHTTTLFSATLQPTPFYTDLLGLPDDTVALDVASPFQATQLQVRVARHISTRYRHRRASAQAIIEVMAAQFAAQPGNYLAFFSSHDYLQDVAAALQARHPLIPMWAQSRRMSEADQQGFLTRLNDGGQGIAFAVLGGSFAEGIDLPGRRLIGAFIATLGLPQVNPINEQIALRIDSLIGPGKGAGHDYTYTFPGLQKVVQAAGRVIRTLDDRGVVHLMDDRYGQRAVQRLLPSWWQIESSPPQK